MTRLLTLLGMLFLLPLSALAQPVEVTSGEHDGFTRLVLNYGTAQDWQIGRTTDGYEVRLTEARPAYDLTAVYDLIGRGRLASVWADPETGALRIGIGCACHAQPFEFRPGIVVIDLKDGPPPKGSSFELALEGGALPDLSSRPPPRPRARPGQTETVESAVDTYDWKSIAVDRSPEVVPQAKVEPVQPQTPAAALPQTDPDLQPLRDVLLQQLSRGAAQGVVDMAHPEPRDDTASEATSVKVRLNDLPGVRVNDQDGDPIGMTAGGAVCVADDLLQIRDWGDERPISEQMAEAMAGLMGEFDAPDKSAQLRAVRFLLFAGFGAEARQVLRELPANLPDEAVLTSLAHLLDGSQDPGTAFAGMAACDTAAAMWAVLGDPTLKTGVAFDRAAALRAFSSLPLHLRRHLGPMLADRFVALGDPAAADAVRDAILRAPGDAGPQVTLMQARLEMDSGNPENAETRIEPLIIQSGPATPDALIALVEARLAQREAVDQDHITALEGLLHERRNSADAPRFAHALVLAQALAGDFMAAFASLAESPEAEPEVWSLLSEIGPDSALLAHAVLPAGLEKTVSPAVAARLARRLSDLGLADAAQSWLSQIATPEPDLAARIALQEKDARTALRVLGTPDSDDLVALQTEALRLLGDEAALAAALAASGDEEARWLAIARARGWSELATSGAAPWQAVAATAVGAPATVSADPEDSGPLAQGQALLGESEATRQAVADLLAVIAAPARSVP